MSCNKYASGLAQALICKVGTNNCPASPQGSFPIWDVCVSLSPCSVLDICPGSHLSSSLVMTFLPHLTASLLDFPQLPDHIYSLHLLGCFSYNLRTGMKAGVLVDIVSAQFQAYCKDREADKDMLRRSNAMTGIQLSWRRLSQSSYSDCIPIWTDLWAGPIECSVPTLKSGNSHWFSLPITYNLKQYVL